MLRILRRLGFTSFVAAVVRCTIVAVGGKPGPDEPRTDVPVSTSRGAP